MRRIRASTCRQIRRQRHHPIRQIEVVDSAVEEGQRCQRLIIRNLMSRFVDPHEREIAVLADLAIFGSVDSEGRVARGAELCGVGVVESKGNGLTAEPIADVICVSVVHTHAQTGGEQHLDVFKEIRVNEIASLLECVVDVVVAGRIVEVHTQRILNVCLVEIIWEIRWRGWVVVWVTNIIDTPITVRVVWSLDVVAAHILRFCAYSLAGGCRAVSIAAVFNLLETTVVHVASELHVVVDCIVDSFDAVCVVVRKFRIVWRLNIFIDDAIDYAERVEVELNAGLSAIGDHLVLLVEVIVKGGSGDLLAIGSFDRMSWGNRPVVSSIRLCPQVELLRVNMNV